MNTPSNVQSKFGGAKVRFPPPLVFLGCVLTAVVLGRSVPLVVPIPSLPRILAGAALALCGLSMVLSARLQFLRTKQNPMPWMPSPELLVGGIYRLTRNPMYVGITLLLFGIGTVQANGWFALAPFVALSLIHFIAVRPEEAYLAAKFGERYLRYKAAVRRYL